MEGRRVDQEIKEAYQKAKQAEQEHGDANAALGRTIPRESDKQLLDEFEQRRQNAELN